MSTQLTKVLLPNAMQQFCDENGKPLAGGLVYFYEPGTTTNKATYLDIDLTVPNDNPVVLDAAGRCIAWGDGIYRQVVQDSLGNLVWDQITSTGLDPASSSVVSVAYDLPIFLQGKPSDGEVFPLFNIVRGLSLPIGLVGSVFTIGTNPTVSSTWTLKKNSTVIGTVAFNSSGVPTISFLALVNFAALDQLSLTGQNPADATGANFAATIVFTVT